MRTPRRSLRATLRSYNRFSIKSILSSTPRSRKRRAALARRGPKKCLTYAGVTDRSKMDSSERFPEHDTSEYCAGDRGLVSTAASSSGAISGDQREEQNADERWIQALRSSALQTQSVRVRVLSESSGTSKWLEITRPTCSFQPPLGPIDVVRVLVSVATRLYQLQVLYPIPRVVERFKGNLRVHIMA